MTNSDILEVRLYDSSHQIFFKGKAKLKDKSDMKRLKESMKIKGVDLMGNDWFD
jgi:hypothetical protein